MSSRASWLSWLGGSEQTPEGDEPLAQLRGLVAQKEAEIVALSQRVQELGDVAERESARSRLLAERSDELAELLGEAETACARLEESLQRAELRCAEDEVRLCTEAGRAEVASKLAVSADERYREIVERWRNAERALVAARHERTLAKEHQVELQMALSRSVQEREQLRLQNQKLQAQLKVAQIDKEDAAAVSSKRLIQVEQRVRFAFDELECLGDDAHHLLRLAGDGMWQRLADDVPAALGEAKSNVSQDWLRRRFEGCATTQDLVAATSDLLSRLRLARVSLDEQLPLQLKVVPLGEGLSGSDAMVRFAAGVFVRAASGVLGAELAVVATEHRDDGYLVCFKVEGRGSSDPCEPTVDERDSDVGTS